MRRSLAEHVLRAAKGAKCCSRVERASVSLVSSCVVGGGETVHCRVKMATREDILPDLSADETMMFLDLWEGFPCLWNPSDREYKNSGQKAKALQTFAEHFVDGWTPDTIMRKFSSLKACFRKERNRQRGNTGGPGKKGWPFFDRMNGFYGATLHTTKKVTRSDCPSDSNRASCGDDEEDDKDGTIEKPAAGGDIQCLNIMERTQLSSSSSGSGSSDQPDTLPALCTPHRGLGNRLKTTPTTPKDNEDTMANFQKSATEYFHPLQDSRKRNQNPEINFAMDVADDVNKIQNKRRRLMLKHTIRDLVHNALIEEMEDEDDDMFIISCTHGLNN